MDEKEQQAWKDFADYRIQVGEAVLEYFDLPRPDPIPSDSDRRCNG